MNRGYEVHREGHGTLPAASLVEAWLISLRWRIGDLFASPRQRARAHPKAGKPVDYQGEEARDEPS